MQKQPTHLTQLRASIVIMQAHNSRFEEYFTDPSSLSFRDHIDILPTLDGTVTEFMRYSAYKKLLAYAEHNPYCNGELAKLDQIIDSEYQAVVEWIDRNEDFFWDEIFDIDNDLSQDDNDDEVLYQWNIKEPLLKRDWLPVIIFSEVMQELYFGKYTEEVHKSGLEGSAYNKSVLEVIGKIKELIETLRI